MPRLSQWLVRTALIYLLMGFSAGALLLIHKGVPWQPLLWRWLPAHIEFLLMGWVVQLTMGVAFWILPRYWQRARRPRQGSVYLAWLLLNVGIWLVVAGTAVGTGRWLLFAGRAAETGAIVAFILHSWPRIISRQGK